MKTLISTSAVGAATTFGQRARATAFSLLATGLLAVPATAYSAIVIDFEVGGDQVEIGNFYSGLGVLFSGDDIAVEEGGQTGAFENTPSPITAMLLLRDGANQDDQMSATLGYSPGFTSVSFFYSALTGGAYEVFGDGGISLISGVFGETAQATCSDNILVCSWKFVDLSGFGVATSIVFTGFGNGQVIFDDVTLEPAPVPLPAAAWLLLPGLAGLGALRRRRAVA
jgi:hypothetical protein